MCTLHTAWLSVILAVLGATACTPPKADMGRTPSNVAPEEYQRRFEAFSRELRVMPFNGLENYLTARATYLSFRFREAYTARLSADMKLSAADRDVLVQDQAAALDAGHEFFVSVMSAVKGLGKLDLKEGPWMIRLTDDRGVSVAPTAIEEVDKAKPREMKYFAFNPSFRRAYRVRFPFTAQDGTPVISDETRFFELSFATAYGRGVARWEILKK